MKPSEKRALEAEKRRMAEERAAVEKQKQDAPSTVTDTPQCGEDAPPRKPYKRKEGFIQSHIRLITFIITATLVLTILGPLGIDMLVAAKKDKVVNNKKDITLEQVYVVADNYGSVTWQTFNDFNYTDRSHDDGKYQKREYPIKDTGFVLVVGGVAGRNVPEYIYIQSYAHAAYADLAKDNVKQFVNKYTQEEN